MNTPWRVVRSANSWPGSPRTTSITWPADSRVTNSGISARSHIATRRSGGTTPSATMMTGGSSVTMREMRRSCQSGRGVEVGHLAAADDLHAVGMDVVQVADQVGRRAGVAHGVIGEAALGVGVTGDPLPAHRLACSNSASALMEVGFIAVGAQATDFSGSQSAMSLCTRRRRRLGLGLQALAQFGRTASPAISEGFQVPLRRRLRHQQEDQQAHGSSSGHREMAC